MAFLQARPTLDQLTKVRQFKRTALGLHHLNKAALATGFTALAPLTSALLATSFPSPIAYGATAGSLIAAMFGQAYLVHNLKCLDKEDSQASNFSFKEQAKTLLENHKKILQNHSKELPAAVVSELLAADDRDLTDLPPLHRVQILQGQIQLFFGECLSAHSNGELDKVNIPTLSKNLMAPAQSLANKPDAIAKLKTYRNGLYHHPIGQEILENFQEKQAVQTSSAQKYTGSKTIYGQNLLSLGGLLSVGHVFETGSFAVSPLIPATLACAIGLGTYLTRRFKGVQNIKNNEAQAAKIQTKLQTALDFIDQEITNPTEETILSTRKRPYQKPLKVINGL